MPMLRTTTKQTGDASENLAEHYLITQGLRVISRNFRYKTGEIDLIMEDDQHLIFVEVRYRKNKLFGSGSETIGVKKQQRLIQTARYYLQKYNLTESRACRFDVVSISGELTAALKASDKCDIQWLPNAFTA